MLTYLSDSCADADVDYITNADVDVHLMRMRISDTSLMYSTDYHCICLFKYSFVASYEIQ